MDAENLIAEFARYSIFEGALAAARPEEVLQVSAKVRSQAEVKDLVTSIEKLLWLHEKEALRIFGPNPAAASAAIRSGIFNCILTVAPDVDHNNLAREVAVMEITPDSRLDLSGLLKRAAGSNVPLKTSKTDASKPAPGKKSPAPAPAKPAAKKAPAPAKPTKKAAEKSKPAKPAAPPKKASKPKAKAKAKKR